MYIYIELYTYGIIYIIIYIILYDSYNNFWGRNVSLIAVSSFIEYDTEAQMDKYFALGYTE